jgi:hypothetical protein
LEVVVEAISASTFCGKLTFFKQCIWRLFFKVPCLDFRAPNAYEATVASDSTASGRLSPVMNTAAATLVWSQFGLDSGGL